MKVLRFLVTKRTQKSPGRRVLVPYDAQLVLVKGAVRLTVRLTVRSGIPVPSVEAKDGSIKLGSTPSTHDT